MERVEENFTRLKNKQKAKKNWFLFSPSETPDLHGLYGEKFKQKYLEYEKKFTSYEEEEKTLKEKIKHEKKKDEINHVLLKKYEEKI
jgi:hypothetical protein